jgi:hypothetical protein
MGCPFPELESGPNAVADEAVTDIPASAVTAVPVAGGGDEDESRPWCRAAGRQPQYVLYRKGSTRLSVFQCTHH